MARYCPECGKPKDAEHHDVVRRVIAIRGDRAILQPLPPGWPDRWRCRLVTVATTPKGKTIRTHIRQRVKKLDTRLIHESRLEDA